MDKVVTENDYPVEQNWILGIPLGYSITTAVILLFLLLFLVPLGMLGAEGWIMLIVISVILIFFMAGLCILTTIIASLSRDNFHYSVEKEFIVFHQGIISKQQKNLPYGVIQDLILSQGIADRILGLTSLTIENASFGGGQAYARGGVAAGAWIGFMGNVATIPGLTLENAEILKKILLAKVKEYKESNTNSGL